MLDIKKIVIRLPNWLGDIVMALPLAERLKAKYPHATITAICKKPFDHVVKNCSYIDEVISFDATKSFQEKLFQRDLKRKIKSQGFDLAILCTRSLSSALPFFQSKIKKVIGQNRPLDFLFLTDVVKFDKTIHQRQKYKALLKPLGITTIPEETALETSSNLFEFPKLDLRKPFLILHPGASYGSSKTWPLPSYETLAKLLLDHLECQIVFCGDKKQQAPSLNHPSLIDLTGKTSLDELNFLIKHARLIVCNDSGPMHLADGLKTPLISLFGSTDPEKTGPKSKTAMVIFHKTPCGPCFKRVCPLDHACMKNITPNEVFETIQKILSQHGPS